MQFYREWYNPLYFILNEIIKDPTIYTVLVYGGKSSSKTVSIAQLLAKECYVKGANSIAFRKESSTIPTTLKKSFDMAIDSQYLTPAFEKLEWKERCNSATGKPSEIVLRGLDTDEKAKGVESYKYIYLDELDHFAKSEYGQITLSLRGILGQKVFATWNPVDVNSWVKTDLVDNYEFIDSKWSLPSEHSSIKISTCGTVVLIRTMYEDNYWIVGSPEKNYGFVDERIISIYESLAFRDANSYKVNVLGEWGKTTYGGEFLKQWKSERHTGDYQYNPELPVHLIFDENVNPYFPCSVFQISKDMKTAYLVHEFAMKHPDNTVSSMCREITRKLKEWGHKEYVFIGGDATSQKSDVKQEKGHDLFRLIMNELQQFNPRRAVLHSNPSVKTSSEFVNSILESEIHGLKIRVNVKCRNNITDFENTKEDKNGAVDKKTVTNPQTKVTYQPYGHFCDILRYFVCYNFANEYEKHQRGNSIPLPIVGKNNSNNRY